eukprot:CAMPEP_0197026620 /NCGR_PEP_ID=MMETSP1384-20130603/6669_1 /TAXON_ID=29189 /ORGANISM="Ammonia sp." /LENGTH=484 /DNA_ID=CAMNT_0042455319 /DNA_START=21 /DNA_END=1475 /DNA_ORIENTATION=+
MSSCLNVLNEDEIDLSRIDSIMDAMFIEQIDQLHEFDDIIQKFESLLQEKDNEFVEQTVYEENEFNLWQCMLESDISHYQSLMQSHQCSLQDVKLEHESQTVKKSLEEQKTFVFEHEVNKLRNQYDTLQAKIQQESLSHIQEYDVIIATSRNYGQQIIFSGHVFSCILSFIDIEDIFKYERVCISWYDAIHNWKGWIINSNHGESQHNNLCCINKYRDIVDNKLGQDSVGNIDDVSSSNYSNDNDKLFYPRFRRFALSIETQKNNMYQVEIVGYSDKNMNAAAAISHDKAKKRVTINPIEGEKKFEKEFSICDVILGNHQRLARIKEKCERLKSRCESDKNTQRGYQMSTKELQREIDIYDKEVKELELQQNSDLNTIKFLKQQIEAKQQSLNELTQIPEQLRVKEEEENKLFQQRMRDLENAADDNTQEIIEKTQKEKETLTKAIKLEQANLRSITEKRDQLRMQYERLKDQITKLTQTGDLL